MQIYHVFKEYLDAEENKVTSTRDIRLYLFFLQPNITC